MDSGGRPNSVDGRGNLKKTLDDKRDKDTPEEGCDGWFTAEGGWAGKCFWTELGKQGLNIGMNLFDAKLKQWAGADKTSWQDKFYSDVKKDKLTPEQIAALGRLLDRNSGQNSTSCTDACKGKSSGEKVGTCTC
ncbi:MAG: hypothetical protein LBL61_02360 [Elusimicrobiota bacterium]|jgi:hypothetical protein|nr:hypothetical protein [Elusimicrobiota bacterium]